MRQSGQRGIIKDVWWIRESAAQRCLLLGGEIEAIESVTVDVSIGVISKLRFPISEALLSRTGQCCLHDDDPRAIFLLVPAQKHGLLGPFNVNFEPMDGLLIGQGFKYLVKRHPWNRYLAQNQRTGRRVMSGNIFDNRAQTRIRNTKQGVDASGRA